MNSFSDVVVKLKMKRVVIALNDLFLFHSPFLKGYDDCTRILFFATFYERIAN